MQEGPGCKIVCEYSGVACERFQDLAHAFYQHWWLCCNTYNRCRTAKPSGYVYMRQADEPIAVKDLPHEADGASLSAHQPGLIGVHLTISRSYKHIYIY